jgi:hypothetical protein
VSESESVTVRGAQDTSTASRRFTTRRRVDHLPASRRYRCTKKLISSDVIVIDGGALASEDDSWSSSDALLLALPLDMVPSNAQDQDSYRPVTATKIPRELFGKRMGQARRTISGIVVKRSFGKWRFI